MADVYSPKIADNYNIVLDSHKLPNYYSTLSHYNAESGGRNPNLRNMQSSTQMSSGYQPKPPHGSDRTQGSGRYASRQPATRLSLK